MRPPVMIMWRRRAVSPLVLSGTVLAAAAVSLAACTGSTPEPSSAPTTPVAAVPTPSSATPSAAPVTRSLLSGRPGAKDGPVLVVKMDNTPASDPHAGIDVADVVYLEEVEGGLTRYAVVFSSRLPKTVGPIRSARISDIELLRQYGRVAFAYSGVQTKMLPVLAAADLIDVSDDHGGTGYRRDNGWRAPDNLFASPSALLKRAGHSAVAVDVGFTFSDEVPAGGRPVTSVTAAYPATKMTFTWSASQGRWLASRNGRPAMAAEGGQLGGTTVIIQYASVTRSIYHDVLGNFTPLTTSTGTGGALILRDGQVWNAKWSRPTAEDGTTWTVNGKEFPLAPGQVWVVLINHHRPATLK